MTVSEVLERVLFVVDADGKPTAALVDIAIWQQIVALLEEAEDQGVVRAYLTHRLDAGSPAELGLIPWEQAEAMLNRLDRHDDRDQKRSVYGSH